MCCIKMILIKLYICIGFIFVSNAQSLFRPNLPLGPFRMVMKALRQCENSKHLPLQAHIYLNKKASNITEIRGNFTARVPFDDSLLLDGNGASWDSIGGWKPNSFVYVTNNACSKSKFIGGNAWYSFTKAFNFSSGNCPIPTGTYSTSTGYDTALLEDNNFPKVYFYGKYKFVAKIKTKDNKLLGCMAYEGEVLDVNAASWSLTGGWKPNYFVDVTNNACSKTKFIAENAWYTFTKAFNLPNGHSHLGQFRVVVNAIRECENSKHLPIQLHLYLNKKSSNITEFRGNVTIGVPFDDSLILDGNVASWDSIGVWKQNSIVFVANNACSKVKFMFGNAWDTFRKAFNMPSGNCPIPMGTYNTSTGYNTALIEDNNFSKVYFYGKYKFVGKIKTKDNKLLACIAYEVELLRPWEV